MKTIEEALSAMVPAFRVTGPERRQLNEAVGQYTVEDIHARTSLPAFSNSAMDGYVLRFQDVMEASSQSVVTLPLAGEARAGGEAPLPLPPGSAMRIFTGAPIPDGANAVVPQEETRAGEHEVEILQATREWAHIRRKGHDLEAGSVMIPRGSRIGAGEVGLLAAQRIGAVTVYRRPRVAILSTGDELRELSDPPEPGTIVNSNAYALAAMVQEAGGLPQVLPNVPDDLEKTIAQMREGLNSDCLITSGGVSVGDYDVVKEAMVRCGVEAEFWKVRMKPGKPLTFGQAGTTPMVGLPGNPVSAMVTFEVFVRPAIRRMLGDPKPYRARYEVTLAHAHEHSQGRLELARAIVTRQNGRFEAHLHSNQGSGALPSMVGINALVLLDGDKREFKAGDRLSAIYLGDELGVSESPFYR